MPKKVFEDFIRNLRRDILTNYEAGSRYLSVREISDKFSVSLQTAQRGVKELKDKGLISSRPNSGIIVQEKESATAGLRHKTIYVISNKQDGHFFSSFYDGAKIISDDYGIKTEFLMNTFSDTSSLSFGNYLTSLKADGLIMLSFPNSELPFYHAIREGVDIVSDIILDKLPILPSVQTDNFKHSYEAGKALVAEGCTKFYVFGYYRQQNKRFLGFDTAVREAGYISTYIEISSISGISETAEILRNYNDHTGLFIGDYSSAYVIDSLCSRQALIPRHILVYDTDDEYFYANYLPPIKAVGPSFKILGQKLCSTLINKWKTGKYLEPLQIKI